MLLLYSRTLFSLSAALLLFYMTVCKYYARSRSISFTICIYSFRLMIKSADRKARWNYATVRNLKSINDDSPKYSVLLIIPKPETVAKIKATTSSTPAPGSPPEGRCCITRIKTIFLKSHL